MQMAEPIDVMPVGEARATLTQTLRDIPSRARVG